MNIYYFIFTFYQRQATEVRHQRDEEIKNHANTRKELEATKETMRGLRTEVISMIQKSYISSGIFMYYVSKKNAGYILTDGNL